MGLREFSKPFFNFLFLYICHMKKCKAAGRSKNNSGSDASVGPLYRNWAALNKSSAVSPVVTSKGEESHTLNK